MSNLLLLGAGKLVSTVTPITLTFLGHAESSANATSYTFNTGYTMVTGSKVIICPTGRSASALAFSSVTANGVAATSRITNTNADGFGATRVGIFEVDVGTILNQNIVVDFGATTAVRAGIGVYQLDNAGSVYATASSIVDGTAATQLLTMDTPASGAAIGVVFHANVSSNNTMSVASLCPTSLVTALSIQSGVGATISWVGLTKNGSDQVLEAGVNGDGVLCTAAWSPA